jgi:hypothetical protein
VHLPWSAPGRWYRGNLHGHTTESDGTLTPAEYAAYYRRRGYDFVAVTDHWRLTDLGAFADRGFAWVPGVELDGRDPAAGVHHVLGLGVQAVPPRAAAATLQGTVDAIRACGGLAFVAHPYWSGQSGHDLLAADGYTGIEVYNATCAVRWGKGLSAVQWDELWRRGRRVWALATDDAHHHPEQGDDLGLGWVMVRAEALEVPALLRALAEGRFYASTGPEIRDLAVAPDPEGRQGALVTVRCSPCRHIHFLCDAFLGRSLQAPPGGELTEASLRVHPRASYVRVECVDALGRTAWSMPVPLGGPGL